MTNDEQKVYDRALEYKAEKVKRYRIKYMTGEYFCDNERISWATKGTALKVFIDNVKYALFGSRAYADSQYYQDTKGIVVDMIAQGIFTIEEVEDYR